MGLGDTNVKLSDIRNETGALFGADDSFLEYNSFSWAQGPPPGDDSKSFWGAGTKSGVSQDILFNPSDGGAGAGVNNNFKFGFYKNYFGYMDQSTYTIELYVENNMPPAGRGFPANNVDFDAGLYSEDLLSDNICPIVANGVPENGGTYGPIDVSQPYTFNVNYLYIQGNYFCGGVDPYNIDIYAPSLEYSASVGGSAGAQSFDYTLFNTPDVQNNGSGFLIEVYFS